ncbi:putative capsid protein 3 [Glossina pallidipes salivary gland hypertrophy virus]|uniref:Putative capsid protein 3 n=1 Tax=Glossina hytrovirus (isolate Glossina pallidipes/Ethiopia/Seibersdorf/-) TaxID=379529 RepID=A0A0Y0K7D5_GHVS|nr:putative capsid protein 3 [Glossina pallidipes salivary gland hypertrophy virus]
MSSITSSLHNLKLNDNKIILKTYYGIVRYLYETSIFTWIQSGSNDYNDHRSQLSLSVSPIHKYVTTVYGHYAMLSQMYENIENVSLYFISKTTNVKISYQWLHYIDVIESPTLYNMHSDLFICVPIALRPYSNIYKQYSMRSKIFALPIYCLTGVDVLLDSLKYIRSYFLSKNIQTTIEILSIYQKYFYLINITTDIKKEESDNELILFSISKETITHRWIVWADEPNINCELYNWYDNEYSGSEFNENYLSRIYFCNTIENFDAYLNKSSVISKDVNCMFLDLLSQQLLTSCVYSSDIPYRLYPIKFQKLTFTIPVVSTLDYNDNMIECEYDQSFEEQIFDRVSTRYTLVLQHYVKKFVLGEDLTQLILAKKRNNIITNWLKNSRIPSNVYPRLYCKVVARSIDLDYNNLSLINVICIEDKQTYMFFKQSEIVVRSVESLFKDITFSPLIPARKLLFSSQHFQILMDNFGIYRITQTAFLMKEISFFFATLNFSISQLPDWEKDENHIVIKLYSIDEIIKMFNRFNLQFTSYNIVSSFTINHINVNLTRIKYFDIIELNFYVFNSDVNNSHKGILLKDLVDKIVYCPNIIKAHKHIYVQFNHLFHVI